MCLAKFKTYEKPYTKKYTYRVYGQNTKSPKEECIGILFQDNRGAAYVFFFGKVFLSHTAL
jgi:hypothetical protein